MITKVELLGLFVRDFQAYIYKIQDVQRFSPRKQIRRKIAMLNICNIFDAWELYS